MDPNSSIDIIAACMTLPYVNARIDVLNKERAMSGNNLVEDTRRREIRDELVPLYRRRAEFHKTIFGELQ